MNLNIIFEENPISRCYLNLLAFCGVKIDNIIVLKKKSIFPNQISLRYNFRKNNYWPIKFLKDKAYKELIAEIEKYFNFPKNFINEMYQFDKLNNSIGNLIISNSSNINSEENIKIFSNLNSEFILNTGKKIIKEPLKINKKFIHIHPGYLPYVRGADSTLWHIKKYNNLGVSAFFMSKEIDTGKVFIREKINFKKIKLKNYQDIDVMTLYRLWYSFFDPLLRGYLFKKIIENAIIQNNSFQIIKDNENKSNYFSFMNKNELRDVFNLIFES